LHNEAIHLLYLLPYPYLVVSMIDSEINFKVASISIIGSYLITSFIWLAFIDPKIGLLSIVELISSFFYLLLMMLVPIIMELIIFFLVYRFTHKPLTTIIIYIVLSILLFFVIDLDIKYFLLKIPCFCFILFLLIRNKKSTFNKEIIDSDNLYE